MIIQYFTMINELNLKIEGEELNVEDLKIFENKGIKLEQSLMN